MVKDDYARTAKRLLEAGVEDGGLEAKIIFEQIFSRSFGLDLLAGRLEREMTVQESTRLEDMLKKRLFGTPIQYIIGEWEFYGMDFCVGEGVLIPRQDTETLIDAAISLMRGKSGVKLLDLCSGTGCIPIVLSKMLKCSAVYAVELYDKAFCYLEKNISRHKAAVTPFKLDVLDESSTALFSGIDLITCNPPYLSGGNMRSLQLEVGFEPKTALYGGEDGLDYYKKIAAVWKKSQPRGGYIAFEIGHTQADEVSKILLSCGYTDVKAVRDLAGKDRVVTARA